MRHGAPCPSMTHHKVDNNRAMIRRVHLWHPRLLYAKRIGCENEIDFRRRIFRRIRESRTARIRPRVMELLQKWLELRRLRTRIEVAEKNRRHARVSDIAEHVGYLPRSHLGISSII